MSQRSTGVARRLGRYIVEYSSGPGGRVASGCLRARVNSTPCYGGDKVEACGFCVTQWIGVRRSSEGDRSKCKAVE